MAMSRSYRLLKISVAVILLGLSLWSMLLPPYFPSSSHALVNTRKITVSSRTDGVIGKLCVDNQDMVRKGQVVALIDKDLASLEREIEQLGFLRKRLETQIANADIQIAHHKTHLEKTTAEFAKRQEKTVEAFESVLKALEDKAAIEAKQLKMLREDEESVRDLLDKGIVTRTKWLELNKLSLESEKRLQSAQSEAKGVATRLDLARTGLQMAQSEGGDALTTEITSIQHELRDLQAEKTDLTIQLGETVSLLETSNTHLEQSRRAEIDSPAEGMVWSCPTVEGQNVSTGQPLIQLADSHSIFIESFFHRYYEGSILPGDHAFIQLRGDSTLRTGRVAEVKVQENGADDLYVINSITPSSSMLRVIVEFDDNQLSMEQVGKLGKVVVTSGKPGIINRSLVRLSLLLRNNQ